jgi:hypothetical protein
VELVHARLNDELRFATAKLIGEQRLVFAERQPGHGGGSGLLDAAVRILQEVFERVASFVETAVADAE